MKKNALTFAEYLKTKKMRVKKSSILVISCTIVFLFIQSCALKPLAWQPQTKPQFEGTTKLNNELTKDWKNLKLMTLLITLSKKKGKRTTTKVFYGTLFCFQAFRMKPFFLLDHRTGLSHSFSSYFYKEFFDEII